MSEPDVIENYLSVADALGLSPELRREGVDGLVAAGNRVLMCQTDGHPDPEPQRPERSHCDHCGLLSRRNQQACFEMNAGSCTEPPATPPEKPRHRREPWLSMKDPEVKIADLIWETLGEMGAAPTFESDEHGELDPDGVLIEIGRKIASVGYAQAWAEGYAGGQDSVYTSNNEFPADIKNPYAATPPENREEQR